MEISDAAALLLGHAKKEIDKGIHDLGLPDYMREGVRLWVLKGISPGDFLKAVICNDFVAAVTSADRDNARRLQEWGKFIYCFVPRDCWGSRAHYDDWQEHRGLEGLYNKIRTATKKGED